MNRRKLGRACLAAIAATTALTVAPHVAGASTSTCKIAEFPANQASQSSLNYQCLFSNSATPAANEISSAQTFHDFSNVSYHQGEARRVTAAAAAIGTNTLTAANGHFVAGDINHPVSGVGIPVRAFIKSITSATVAVMNLNRTVATPASAVVLVENTYTRSVADGVNGNATTSLTSATANFTAADAGKGISGTNIKPGTTIASVTNPTTVVLSQAGIACGTASVPPAPFQYVCSPQVINISTTAPVATARVITGTNTTSVITSSTAGFSTTDIGQSVNGGANYITAVTGTTATVTPATLVANAAAHTITIGQSSATAPVNGEQIMNLNVALALSPALSAGAQSCAGNTPTGFGLQGVWANPGSFTAPGGFVGAVPAGKVIGQILFKTVVTFAAYVVQSPGDATIGATTAHYDLAFPNLPTGLAKCPAPSAVPVLSQFSLAAVTSSQNAIATGVGVPSSGQFRYLNPALVARAGLKAALVDGTATSPTHLTWGTISKTCSIPAPATNPVLPGAVGSCETP